MLKEAAAGPAIMQPSIITSPSSSASMMAESSSSIGATGLSSGVPSQPSASMAKDPSGLKLEEGTSQ